MRALVTWGLVLVGAVAGVGAAMGGAAWAGAAGFGGAVALGCQASAVALLRPAMRAEQRVFLGRWLGGMAIRASGLALVLGVAVAQRAAVPALPAAAGFLLVLLPLLFVETKFLR